MQDLPRARHRDRTYLSESLSQRSLAAGLGRGGRWQEDLSNDGSSISPNIEEDLIARPE